MTVKTKSGMKRPQNPSRTGGRGLQPRRASQYFDLLSGGRYPQVMAPLEGESFLVIDRQGGHVPPERLSRGTGEQLYPLWETYI